jgi:hypothetical protein
MIEGLEPFDIDACKMVSKNPRVLHFNRTIRYHSPFIASEVLGCAASAAYLYFARHERGVVRFNVIPL